MQANTDQFSYAWWIQQKHFPLKPNKRFHKYNNQLKTNFTLSNILCHFLLWLSKYRQN